MLRSGSQVPSDSVFRRRSRLALTALAFMSALAVVSVATACIPQERSAAREVEEAGEAPAEPPVFPATGPVPRALLIDGLVYDFTANQASLDLWVPPAEQARCAATRVVDTLGPPRLSELGFRPATSCGRTHG